MRKNVTTMKTKRYNSLQLTPCIFCLKSMFENKKYAVFIRGFFCVFDLARVDVFYLRASKGACVCNIFRNNFYNKAGSIQLTN